MYAILIPNPAKKLPTIPESEVRDVSAIPATAVGRAKGSSITPSMCSQPRRYTLTDAALETLSIIAYKQPVTKIEIENIRGVNSDRAVSKLVELGLVKEVGRLDAPGRPMLFGTTEDFLRSFGVQSIDELPTISEDMVEQYKEEAELELASESFDADNQEDSDGQITLGI